jgi:hypothetical protein
MTLTITNDETGRFYDFASETAWEDAIDWYNNTSKADLIAYMTAHATPAELARFSVDEHTMAADWADQVMAVWARINRA